MGREKGGELSARRLREGSYREDCKRLFTPNVLVQSSILNIPIRLGVREFDRPSIKITKVNTYHALYSSKSCCQWLPLSDSLSRFDLWMTFH